MTNNPYNPHSDSIGGTLEGILTPTLTPTNPY